MPGQHMGGDPGGGRWHRGRRPSGTPRSAADDEAPITIHSHSSDSDLKGTTMATKQTKKTSKKTATSSARASRRQPARTPVRAARATRQRAAEPDPAPAPAAAAEPA